MKNRNKVWMGLALVCLFAAFANAADLVSYTASNSPGSNPDGNGNTVDVWTVDGAGGAGRSYLQGMQDGNAAMWAIWDNWEDGGTYATHTFDGGALTVGQSVSIDYAHNTNIDNGKQTGIRFLDGANNEVQFGFIGGNLNYSKYDTGTGIYESTDKLYDNYDIFQVVFTLTGSNSYTMTVSEGSISDALHVPSGWKSSDDSNPDVGNIIDSWTGTFTGSAITGIQVYTEGGETSDQWFDNLTIDAKPYDPFPAYRQQDVTVSGLELAWSIPPVTSQVDPNLLVIDPNLVSFNLYYNDDPNLAVSPVSVTQWDTQAFRASYTPSPDLIKNATYYWRVDTVRDDGIAEGDVWVFDTELTRVVILSDPAHQTVEAGATAVFSVTISTESPATYQWYQYVDGISDVMLTDGGDISGTTTDTLSIANAELADEGLYYCILNNDANIEVPSDMVPLGVKRRIAYWPFENNVFDSVISGSPDTIVVGDPNFVPEGILGDAVVFTDGTDMLYMDPEQNAYFDICNYEMTVAVWVKTTDNQNWDPLVARNGEDGQGWQLRKHGNTNNRPCFTTRTQATTDNDDGTPANRGIYDGNWHYVVGTFDGNVKKVYIDGIVSRLYSSDNGSLVRDSDTVAGPIRASGSPVSIAGRVRGNLVDGLNVELGSVIAGTYDEVEIYNYALDADTIAQTYADVTGTDVCLTQTYDLDGDCMVNLNDLGLLASEWLNSQLVEPMP